VRTLVRLVLAALALSSGSLLGTPVAAQANAVTVTSGSLTASVELDPFAISFTDGDARLLSTAQATPLVTPGALGFSVLGGTEAHQLGYSLDVDASAWFSTTSATQVGPATFEVATTDPLGRTFTVTIVEHAPGVLAVEATLSDTAVVALTGASFVLGDAEHTVGFGERSDAVDQRGRIVTTWNEEGPFSAGVFAPVTDPVFGDRWQGPQPFPGSNFTMPWFVSSAGYGFLLDSTWMNEFDMGATDSGTWTVATREPALRYRLYAGPTTADIVERFTADTGRQPKPAEWFFGPWLQPGPGPEFWRANDVPLTVAQTYAHYLPCAAQFGNRGAQRERVAGWHEQGIKVTTYVNSFVCSGHPAGAYTDGDSNGWFIQLPIGGTYPVPYVAYLQPDGPYHGVVDFTNADAAAFWQRLILEAIEDGYDGWMEDFGEYVPVDAVMADGSTGLAHHNDYCRAYHRASHELTWPLKGTDFAQFIRCGYTGAAPYARIVWGADPSEDFSRADGLAAAVSQGISMGLSGIGYWGSDVGGFHAIVHAERADVELQSRWLEFGAFSGVLRTQGTGYPRPSLGPIATYPEERAQVYEEPVLPIWRKFAKLRTQLFPYTWQAAMDYQETGLPIMRHLSMAFPDDPGVWEPAAEYEFLFGPDILVAPVIEDEARERDVWLPPGEWVNFWNAVTYDEMTGSFDDAGRSDVIVAGGQVVTVDAPLDEIPLFVRAGTCLDLLPADTFTLADFPGIDDSLDDALGRERSIGFAADCAAGAARDNGETPTTGAGLSMVALALVAVGFAFPRRRLHAG